MKRVWKGILAYSTTAFADVLDYNEIITAVAKVDMTDEVTWHSI